MKLYYAPGACSLAVHIALREAGLEFSLEKVNLADKTTENGQDFMQINPKGYVPALQLDDGQVLTEVQVILQYVADLKPGAQLVPVAGTLDRYRLMEWLAFIATEVHKGFGPFWNPKTPEAVKMSALGLLSRRFDYLAARLDDQPWLMGETYTVADAYLFTLLRWTEYHQIELADWPKLFKYVSSAMARPAVQQAMRAEGLIE